MDAAYDCVVDDHNYFYTLLANLESDVSQAKWDEAQFSLLAFSTAFRHHIELEESIYFPMIKKVAGNETWPVEVLSAEHSRLKLILLRMESAVSLHRKNDFILHVESFLIQMHTHSVKEEQILYKNIKHVALLANDRPDSLLSAHEATVQSSSIMPPSF
jgi:hemerythrin-like domain-containing protein